MIPIPLRLRDSIGLDPSALDPARLQWIVKSRSRAVALATPADYPAYLQAHPAELDALIDEVVVPETRFFRDPAVFEHLRLALLQLAAANPGPLRLLSAPCGTGQEAYSLAATLRLIGLPPARFTIDAFDISPATLATAGAGVYPEQALRHLTHEQQRALATPHEKHWTVHAALRERVRFERRNLAAPNALADLAPYHLILCRNLFIYLCPQARVALAQSLAGALLPGGRLILGTADRVEELSIFFAPVRPPASFAFVPRITGPTSPVTLRVPSIAVSPRGVGQAVTPGPSTAAETLLSAETLLTAAHQHTAQGDFREAERRCRQALYLAPTLLPALELLETLWLQHPSLRLRRALQDRILRNRPVPIPPLDPRQDHA